MSGSTAEAGEQFARSPRLPARFLEAGEQPIETAAINERKLPNYFDYLRLAANSQ